MALGVKGASPLYKVGSDLHIIYFKVSCLLQKWFGCCISRISRTVTIFSERKQALCEVLNSLGIFPGSNMKVVLAQIYKKQIRKEQ